jgi:hypothetical protein
MPHSLAPMMEPSRYRRPATMSGPLIAAEGLSFRKH